MSDLAKLCAELGYEFSDKTLLERALRHRSVGKNNNERLEFLGDAAVNFIIGEALFKRFPKAKEGDLSRLRASLVRGQTLAELAQSFAISEYLNLGLGEQRSGGSKRESILADAMEAIIGALYLDADFLECQRTVLRWYAERLDIIKTANELKDPKTQLQEYLQGRKFPLPTYEIIKTKGEAHKQIFHIKCSVEGLKQSTVGKGTSRRKAEQEAAEAYLELINHG